MKYTKFAAFEVSNLLSPSSLLISSPAYSQIKLSPGISLIVNTPQPKVRLLLNIPYEHEKTRIIVNKIQDSKYLFSIRTQYNKIKHKKKNTYIYLNK